MKVVYKMVAANMQNDAFPNLKNRYLTLQYIFRLPFYFDKIPKGWQTYAKILFVTLGVFVDVVSWRFRFGYRRLATESVEGLESRGSKTSSVNFEIPPQEKVAFNVKDAGERSFEPLVFLSLREDIT